MIRLLSIIAPDYDAELQRRTAAERVEQPPVEMVNDTSTPFVLPEWVLYIILGLLLVFVVWFILTQTRLMQRIKQLREYEVPVPAVEEDKNPDTDIRNHDFESELDRSLGAHDYVLAIHLLYLKSLKHLDTKHRIVWTAYKTPMMYIEELRIGKMHLSELTRLFQYTTYGHYPASRELYDRALTVQQRLCSVEKRGGDEDE